MRCMPAHAILRFNPSLQSLLAISPTANQSPQRPPLEQRYLLRQTGKRFGHQAKPSQSTTINFKVQGCLKLMYKLLYFSQSFQTRWGIIIKTFTTALAVTFRIRILLPSAAKLTEEPAQRHLRLKVEACAHLRNCSNSKGHICIPGFGGQILTSVKESTCTPSIPKSMHKSHPL